MFEQISCGFEIFSIRIMVFPLDDKFVFGDNFFILADNFFFAEGDKKNYSAKKKKIIHQQTNLLIQRKHHYTYDITFLCHPHPLFWEKVGKKSRDIISNISYIGSTFLLQSTFNIVSPKYNLNIFSINEHVLQNYTVSSYRSE